MENAIAVLSDLKSRKSDVYYGGFSRMLRLGDCGKDTRLSTIWEEEIFRIVHPDDLQSKMLQELRFYQYVKQLPSGQCSRFYLAACLRMRSRTDAYLHALTGCITFLCRGVMRCGWRCVSILRFLPVSLKAALL